MEKFKFDLQRFGEVEDEDVEQPGSGDSTEENGQKAEFRLDENGRIVFLHDDDDETDDEDDEEIDEEPADEEDDEPDDTPKKEQAPEKYTAQQLKDLDFEDLDPKKIPEEMLPWYRSMQGAFTRKMQKLAEKEKGLAQEQPPKQEEQTPDVKQHIQGLANLARFQACQVLQIEPEDFDRTDDDHEAAYQIALMNINKAVDETVKKEKALMTFDEEMAESDADYYAIKQWAKESYINKMPYDDRLGLEDAVARGDTKLLAKKYMPMLKAAYNKEHGKETPDKPITEKVKEKARVSKEPPKLESGKNTDVKKSGKFDASELKGKTLNEQINLLVKAGLARP